MKIIVPLAGLEGEVEKEFKEFKNLIKVHDKYLIEYIVDKRPYDLGRATFVLLKETEKKYNIASRLINILGNKIEIFVLDKLTEGAACSVMAYLEERNIDEDILVDLADQYLSLNNSFSAFINENKSKAKGIIPVFKSRYWKWSYAAINKQGFVEQIEEKVNPPISNNATAGIYYFSSSIDYISATKTMVAQNKRVKYNNQFFVSCVYNELPKNSVITFPTQIICPLGSVQGIRAFEQIIW